MSDIIDPQSPVPPKRRPEVSDESAVRAAAYPSSTEDGYFPQGPVLVRSSDFEMKHRGLAIGAFSMVIISLLTFWMPGFGSLMAGLTGGFFAKRWGRAFAAAAFASVAVPLTMAFLNGMKATGDLRFLYGLGFRDWTILHIVSLFLGAAMGVYSCPLEDRSGGLRRELPE